MQPYLIAVIVVAAVLVFAVLVLFALAAVCRKMGFSARCDKNPLLRYYEGKDFNLPERDLEIRKGEIALRGKVYGTPSETLVVFCHGLGAGHLAYTTEIACLVGRGIEVVAVDYEGCNLSDGKNIRGFYSGVESVLATVRAIRKKPEFQKSKIWLVGHSWGGYAALCAAQRERVEGVVAVSAPDSPADILYLNASQVLGKPLCLLMKPFWWLIDFLMFGIHGNARASAIGGGETPVLLVHGEEDRVVPLKYSAYERARGGNVRKLLCEGKAHNPYCTPAAQRLLNQLSANLMRADRMTEEEKNAYFGSFDFAAATEEDAEVMEAIIRFLGK